MQLHKYIIAIALLFCSALTAAEDDWFIYLGDKKPYQAPRKNISAAEAMPPLPLPATPLRRTERKKPPQPDYLIGKVIWGQSASFQDSSGNTLEIADWNLCPTDLEKFMQNSRKLSLNYHWQNVNLNSFHYNPQQLPALLFSGTRSLKLGEIQLKSLRQYISSGGMVICDSIAGSPYFYNSVRTLAEQMFPESSVRTIPLDHPLYHIFVSITNVNNPRNPDTAQPELEGIYIGSRIGMLISKYGLGCGWNQNTNPLLQLPAASFYDARSSTEIGINLAAYIVGYAQPGMVEGRPEMFSLADQQSPTDEFIFAQIKHAGSWNVHPGAATALMLKLRKHTAIRVNLQRRSIDLGKDKLDQFPFLYLTGLDSFSLSDRQIAILRNYLTTGGFLLINNGMGMATFDSAVKRELAKVLPNTSLKDIPTDHSVYSSLFKIDKVEFSPILQAAAIGTKPKLQGINIGGELKVIYSPQDLEAGWLDTYYPMIKGYDQTSSRQLGMNIITYIMTN